VGLSLRDLNPEDVSKGDLAVGEKFPAATRLEAEISPTRFYKDDITAPQFFVLSGLKCVACKAKRLEGGRFELSLSAPLNARAGETLQLFLPEAMPRAIGSAKVAKVLA
jgi:selenocysteine-specific translation elongation factor